MALLITTTLFVAQLAAAALHGYLAYCFYPDRYRFEQLFHFMAMMVLCSLFHLTTAFISVGMIFEHEASIEWLRLGHAAITYLLVPMLIPGLLADYKLLPNKPNYLARGLVLIAKHYIPITKVVYVMSFVMIALLFIDKGFSLHLSGWLWPLQEPEYIALYFGAIWCLMLVSGLRPVVRTKVYGPDGRVALLGQVILTAIALFLILVEDFFFPGPGVKLHFITVPFALVFAWYRYRWALADVIAKQFLGLVWVMVAVWVAALTVPKLMPELQPITVITIVLVAYLMARWSLRWLDELWMPSHEERKQFRRRYTLQLASSESQQEAFSVTEQAMASLFSTDVAVNKNIEDRAERLVQDGHDDIYLSLGYIKGIYPWFSESRSLAAEVLGQLINHLEVLALRAEQHQQAINLQELETLAVKAERDAMRAQIRPHFLFNVLNTIHSFVRRDPEQAERVIELLAELMRGVIQTSERDIYPLRQEFELAETYLSIEKIRHGDRLHYSLDIAPELLSHPVPPFSLQPLVENAVKYSVDFQLQQACLSVRAEHLEGQLKIYVVDNGPGPQGSASGGLGLATDNIRERLSRLYGDQASLQLHQASPQGCEAVLSLPWQLANSKVVENKGSTSREY